MSKQKIYVFVFGEFHDGDVEVVGVVEDKIDGEDTLRGLAGHISSSKSFARHDMGFGGSDWKHKEYDAHCGKGKWELEWVDDPKEHHVLSKYFEESKGEKG